MQSMGDRIRQEREKLGLSQGALGKACGGLSKASVSGWEIGKSAPTGPNLVACAAALKVREKWLTSGRGPKAVAGPGPDGVQTPRLDFVQAGTWTETDGSQDPPDGYLVSSRDIGPNSFALTIKGNSMLPEFMPGDDIIVDPDVKPRTGDFVVAKREKDQEATFKRFYERADSIELKPLNTDEFKVLKLDKATPGKIVGVMVEHRRYRR